MRWNKLGQLIPVHANLPPAIRIMNQAMMVAAQQNQIAEVSAPTRQPRRQMMGVAPSGRPVAVREGAPPIPGDQRAPQRTGGQPTGAAGVENLPGTAEHQRKYPGVTGHTPGSGG